MIAPHVNTLMYYCAMVKGISNFEGICSEAATKAENKKIRGRGATINGAANGKERVLDAARPACSGS